MRQFLLRGGVAALALLAAGSALAAAPAAPASATAGDIPAGITLQGGRAGTLFADARGRVLYVYDEDKGGQPTCTADCAAAWPALTAPAGAAATGDFTVVDRADGTRQWAWKGKPLYLSAKDQRPGETAGEAPGGKFHALWSRPGVGLALPDGIGVAENLTAGGHLLVDQEGLPLYAFSGDLKNDRTVCAGSCAGGWMPVAAAQLANPVGDFTIVSRPDGTRQWAFRGRPLYRFGGDVLPSDVNGLGRDTQWQPALVLRYPTPAEVSLRPQTEHGPVFATPDGRTLYLRDRYIYTGPGGHNTQTNRPIPQIGRAMGTLACEGECTRTWQPLAAPAEAQAAGLWSVVTRADGSRQWAYRDFPLYTFAGDTVPGEMNGYDSFVLTDGGNALYWRFAKP
jgi:predicted lipoprotein with Yx(FWY)xxD motif